MRNKEWREDIVNIHIHYPWTEMMHFLMECVATEYKLLKFTKLPEKENVNKKT